MLTKIKDNRNTYYIYMIECKINRYRYIGFTSRTPQIRFTEHVNTAIDGDNRPLYRDMRKYCNTKFCFINPLRLKLFHKKAKKIFKLKTLTKGKDYKSIFRKEKHYIRKFNTYKKGYNQTVNG